MMIELIGVIFLGLVIVLYTLLVVKLPLGFLAMGGKYPGVLPKNVRIQVLISIPAQLFAVYVLLSLGQLLANETSFITRIFGHVFMIYFIFNAGLNLMSKSYYEKLIMTPIALYLAFAFFVGLYL